MEFVQSSRGSSIETGLESLWRLSSQVRVVVSLSVKVTRLVWVQLTVSASLGHKVDQIRIKYRLHIRSPPGSGIYIPVPV